MVLKLKTVDKDGATYAEVKDGKPVYIEDTNNSEVAYDAPAAVATIGRLNGEAKNHRENKEAAEEKLKTFEGIEDPVAAKKALETVANIDAGTLLQAGKVEEIKTAAIQATKSAYEGQIAAANEKVKALTTTTTDLTSKLHGEKLTNAFSTSKFIGEKLVVPPSMVQKVFGDRFKVEEDKLVAYDEKGQKLYSQERPGEEPTFDEALGIIVNNYDYRDTILKGKGNSGGGGGGGGNGPNGQAGNKQISRPDFQKLSPLEQQKHMREGFTVFDPK